MLNITENQENDLFDCSVLHDGVYDLGNIPPSDQYFFGSDPLFWKNLNPTAMSLVDPTDAELYR